MTTARPISYAFALVMIGLASPALAECSQKPIAFVGPFSLGGIEEAFPKMIAKDFSERCDVAAVGHTFGSFLLDAPLAGPLNGTPALVSNPLEPIGIFVTCLMGIAAPHSSIEVLAEYAGSNDVVLTHFGTGHTPTQFWFNKT